MIDLHLHSAMNGYTDSSDDIISNIVHIMMKQILFQKKLRKR